MANVIIAPPTVDLEVNNSNGSIVIAYNASVNLSWTTTGADSCDASDGWSGPKLTSGSESTGNLISSRTYNLTCTGPSGSVTTSVGVNVEDCKGTVNGIVRGIDNNLIEYAEIRLIDTISLEEKYIGLTNYIGEYRITGIACGKYHISTSKENYASSTKSDQQISEGETTIDITLLPATTCQADCTYIGDSSCHAECEGKNGCKFYNSVAMDACTMLPQKQIGWEANYNSSHKISCCTGEPFPRSDLVPAEGEISTCASENLVEITRVLRYKGKPVNFVVVVCK